MRFRRIRDNQMVPDSEALDGSGTVKDGYAASFGYGQRTAQDGDYFGFNMAFMDQRPSGGTAVFLQDSGLSENERAAIVARAELLHRTRSAYLGDRAPAFTDTMAQAAVSAAVADRVKIQTDSAALAAAAEVQHAANVTARAQMIDRLNNAWKK